MKIEQFDHLADMELAALALLREHLALRCAGPHAVMFTGGQTPLGLYRRLEDSPGEIDPGLHLLLSDERHVPPDSSENNFAKMQPMIDAMGIGASHIMRVHTEFALELSADRYDQELVSYIRHDGRITLGILGVGDDGHVASLFTADDLARAVGRYAIAVPRANGPDRVSVTPDLLAKVERVVFLAAGPEKADIVQQLSTQPEQAIAAQAVQGAGSVELWFAEQVE